jgi:tetratricopeptide (TPR) repeat protein
MRIRIGWIVICLVIAVFGTANGLAADDAQVKQATALFDKGVKAAQAGKLDEAEALFQQSIEQYPLPGTYVELGKIQMAHNNPAKAVEFYQQARDAYAKIHDEKVKRLAQQQNQQRDYSQEDQQSTKPTTGGFAKVSVEKTRSQRMEDNRQVVAVPDQEADIPALFYLYLGGAYVRLGKLDLAEKELQTGIAKDAKMAPLHFNLAVIYLMQGKYEESAEAARQAKKLGFQLPPQFVTDLETRGHLKL